MTQALDWIDDAGKVGSELRELIREAHAAIKDLHRAINEAHAAMADMPTHIRKHVDETIGEQVAAGLEGYKTSLNAAIDAAGARVDRRFDTLTALMLGEDPENRRRGRPSIPQIINAYRTLEDFLEAP